MSHMHSLENSNSPTKKNSSFYKKQKKNSASGMLKKKIKIKSEILNKKWKVFRVSPVYNFSFNNLKFFEKKFNEDMNSKKNGTLNSFFKSQFSQINFKLKNQNFEGLQVELFRNETQSSYLGIFILLSDIKPRADDSSVSLPVLLVEASAQDVYGVHSCLCKIFDCDIQPVTFSFYAIIFFFVKLLETERSNMDVSKEQVIMEFNLPGCDIHDKIKVSLNLQDVIVVFAVVMNDLQEKHKDITTLDIVLEFYNKILNHVYQTFKLDLIYAELQKVAFPDAFLTINGQVKNSTDSSFLSCLNVLKCFTPLDAVINL